MTRGTKTFTFFIFLLLAVLPSFVVSECTCDKENGDRDRAKALKYKLAAIASIITASAIGVLIPSFGKIVPALRPEKDIFFLVKAFAAGVVLATGFVHVLNDGFNNLTSPCLSEHPWAKFPFTGFVAMCTAMGTLIVETFAMAHFKKLNMRKVQTEANGNDEEKNSEHDDGESHHLHTDHHAIHGHAHHGSTGFSETSQLLRHRIVAQVLELGIIVHSVIIGLSMGTSESPQTIKPLITAMAFHQCFEGMGLGSVISQAKYKNRTLAIMALFFALTTPLGIAIGIGVTNVYDANSQTALLTEGILSTASAGLLIYMALVDLLAADFMIERMQSNTRLQIGATISMLMGSGLMSLLGKWT
ncbi:zinc transporter 8-like [Prosopis cineraria]|uniref:zinc transporter 8-like n=1 Tax=Prosopis cineraria TaxID=364024 RepID=UPI00240F1B4C|nr:zinc transporter 8-like [Prosopis cineraria]